MPHRIFTILCFYLFGTCFLTSIVVAQPVKPPVLRVYPIESFHSLPGISRQFDVVFLSEAPISGNVSFRDNIYPIHDHAVRISVFENVIDFGGGEEKTVRYEGEARTTSSGKSFLTPFEFSVTYRKPQVSIGSPRLPTIFLNCLNVLSVDSDGYPQDEWDLGLKVVPTPNYTNAILDEFDLPATESSEVVQFTSRENRDNFGTSTTTDTIFFSSNAPNRIAIVPSSRNLQVHVFATKRSTGDSVLIKMVDLTAISPPLPRVKLLSKSGKESKIFTRKDSVTISIQPEEDFKAAMPWEGRYECDGVELYSVLEASSKEKDGRGAPIPTGLIRIETLDNRVEYGLDGSNLGNEGYSVVEHRIRVPIEFVRKPVSGNKYAFSTAELSPGHYLVRVIGMKSINGIGQTIPIDFGMEQVEFRIIVH